MNKLVILAGILFVVLLIFLAQLLLHPKPNPLSCLTDDDCKVYDACCGQFQCVNTHTAAQICNTPCPEQNRMPPVCTCQNLQCGFLNKSK